MEDSTKTKLYDMINKHLNEIKNKSPEDSKVSFDFKENFIRREKRKRLETQKEIIKMRAQLPEYDLNDIRMFRLEFHEALILNLDELGYVSTEAYIKQLFEHNERQRKEAGPQNALWTRPLLKNSDSELKKLSDALMKAEDEHNKGNFCVQIETLLVVAIDFAFNYHEWFWLAEDLFLQCIDYSNKTAASAKHEAISRYVYAKMLMEKARDYKKAEVELNIARELSAGKAWLIKAYLPTDNNSDTLFMNCNYLLHKCYMRQARQFMKTDQNTALELATTARRRAIEACYRDGETKALYIKGQCELDLGDTKSAISTLSKAYYIQAKLKSHKGMCEARVELSKAYLMHGNTRLALQTLMDLKTMAEEHGFQFYLAQAYRYLGEYYLNCGEPQRATPLLSDALHIFHDTNNMLEADQVRNLGALSTGLELMPAYIALLQRTDRRCGDWFDNLIKLVKWKDSREQFWADKAEKGMGTDMISQAMTQTTSENVLTRSEEFQELSAIFETKNPFPEEEREEPEEPESVSQEGTSVDEEMEMSNVTM